MTTDKIFGIYGIYVGKQIVYIGQSTDINRRMANHLLYIAEPELATTQKNMYTKLGVYATEVDIKPLLVGTQEFWDGPDSISLDQAEYILIRALKPVFNKCGLSSKYNWAKDHDFSASPIVAEGNTDEQSN